MIYSRDIGKKMSRSFLMSDPVTMKIAMNDIIKIKTKQPDAVASIVAVIGFGAGILDYIML